MKNRKGLTLIEVILTIVIIGIISIPVFTIFNTGLVTIVRAGDRTEAVFVDQGEMDEKIQENENIEDGTEAIKVTIPELGFEKEVKGKILNSESFTTFVPNKVSD